MAEYWGYETVLKRDDVAIAQISNDLDGPNRSQDEVEVTHRDTSKKRKYIPGLQDDGEVSFSLIFDPGNGGHDHLTGLQKLYEDGVTDTFQIVYSDGTEDEFDAFLTAFEPSAPMEDALTASVTLRLDGTGITTTAPTPP